MKRFLLGLIGMAMVAVTLLAEPRVMTRGDFDGQRGKVIAALGVSKSLSVRPPKTKAQL